jgi:hypothetical protein
LRNARAVLNADIKRFKMEISHNKSFICNTCKHSQDGNINNREYDACDDHITISKHKSISSLQISAEVGCTE